MNDRLSQLLQDWALRDSPQEDEVFLDQGAIDYLGRKMYDDYEPAQFDRFWDRLDRWLHNVDDEEDQQTLFCLLKHLFFLGRPEYESLCRAAYHGPISRWLIEKLNISIADENAMSALETGTTETWFCPITDSMRINSFLKVNKLTGHSHRPDWRSLRKFGDGEKIRAYIQANSIQRIVLLEDFVGSGTQMESVIDFAAKLSTEIEVLAVPLVICPAGDNIGRGLAEAYANISYEPVMKIRPATLIKPDPQIGEPALFPLVRNLIAKVRDRLGVPETDPESQRYHGFKGTGAIVAMYSNCPNNSLPIIYDETETWSALFPRIKRV
ncbi:MAG: hypothetical protein ACLQFI_22095 [Methylocella sp.]